jgi:hypothetical protein
MNHEEAATVLHDYLQQYRQRSYAELVTLLETPQVAERRGASGANYQLEVIVHWDDRRGGALRVLGTVNDGGWRSFRPLTDDFILAPDGRFLGE